MTQEEAINRLKEEIDEYTPFAEKWNEARLDIKALNMAIQALEQEPCEDAISREDVINLKWQGEASKEFLEGYANAIEDARVLPSVNPQKWIPVSEKLPEERKSVLVYAPEYKNIYCAYLDGDTWFIFGGYGSYAVANVIAWMPLPEPYREESDDNTDSD